MSNFLRRDVSGMPSSSRPRGMSGAGSAGSGRPAVTAPMSERQQMALLMQMTSISGGNDTDIGPGPGGHNGPTHSRTTRDRINERGETALHIASKKGDQDTVKKLLEQGANPNVTDFAGWTPLHEACNHGHYNVALALVKAGANINATGLENDTPLHDAAITGQLKLVKMLVERGADPTFKNQKGKAPCDVAAAAVYNYLLQARDNALGRHGHMKKTTADSGGHGGRRGHASVISNNNSHQQQHLHHPVHYLHQPTHVNVVGSGGMGATGVTVGAGSKDKYEDDIYEFKSTPKDSSSSSSDEKESSHVAASGILKKGDKLGDDSHLVHQLDPHHGPMRGVLRGHVDGQRGGKDPHVGVHHTNVIVSGGHPHGSIIVGPHGPNGTLSVSAVGVSGVLKRAYSELMDVTEDVDETRRKKRREVDPLGGIKEGSVGPLPPSGKSGGGAGGRGGTLRQEKGGRGAGGTPSAKGLGLAAKNALDRKSPCASPKPPVSAVASVIERNVTVGGVAGLAVGQGAGSIVTVGGTVDIDGEGAGGDDGGRGNESGFGGASAGGPKVPPLKIVIPQQTAAGDTETGGATRNGKNAITRSHAALPYVVASSNSNDSTADKESTSSRSASPADTKSSDEKTPAQTLKDERTQQRVLRSSHRGGNSNSSLKDGSMDRSNNSSPQMAQQCGSPSSQPNAGSETGGSASAGGGAGNGANSSGNRSITPSNSGGTAAETESGTTKNAQGGSSASGTGTGGSNDGGGNGGSGSGTASGNTNANAGGSGSSSSSSTSSTSSDPSVHPRKRKIKGKSDQSAAAGSGTAGSNGSGAAASDGKASSSGAAGSGSSGSSGSGSGTDDKKESGREETGDVHPHDQPITNCYQMYLNIRKQIERRQKGLFPVQPKPPQGFKDYLMNRCTYALAGKTPAEPNIQAPVSLPIHLKELYLSQEKERHKLKMQHIVEKEKLVLAVEQEILRVHGRAARALANQSMPFSVCTILKDEEVYNIITPEQEEKDRNARSRYNGRLFLSWLQDVDDKWEKIKEAMLLRHHNEAESLHAVQKMDWEWNMKEHLLCEFKAKPVIEETYVPMVNVNDDFDLLPA